MQCAAVRHTTNKSAIMVVLTLLLLLVLGAITFCVYLVPRYQSWVEAKEKAAAQEIFERRQNARAIAGVILFGCRAPAGRYGHTLTLQNSNNVPVTIQIADRAGRGVQNSFILPAAKWTFFTSGIADSDEIKVYDHYTDFQGVISAENCTSTN